MVSPAVVVAAATRSASDSILRCREEERFRLQSATNPRLHRFLISCPDLRIDAGFSPETAQRLHRFLISCPDLRIDARFSPETPSRMHRFLISGGEFGNHCSTIVAAVRNCPPAAPVAATNFRVRFYSSLPQREMVPPAAVVAAAIFRIRF